MQDLNRTKIMTRVANTLYDENDMILRGRRGVTQFANLVKIPLLMAYIINLLIIVSVLGIR